MAAQLAFHDTMLRKAKSTIAVRTTCCLALPTIAGDRLCRRDGCGVAEFATLF